MIHPEIRQFWSRLFFSFLRQKFRQYNSRTIRHRNFRFKILNRSCYRLSQVYIWFQVLRKKAVKRPKNRNHMRHHKYRTIRRGDFWLEKSIGLNTVYLRYTSHFKFCLHKWIRDQKLPNVFVIIPPELYITSTFG